MRRSVNAPFQTSYQGSTHNVVKLAVHLPGQSSVVYRANATNDQIRRMIRRGDRTTLTAFFLLCIMEPDVAGTMLYKDIPTVYRWNKRNKEWVQYRKYAPSIGRIVHVSLQDPERFYLRLLLGSIRGPTSFEDLRTIDGITYGTFHEAALAAGYLDNDQGWEECLAEAAHERMPYQLRQLFAIILVYSLPSSPFGLWERFKDQLSEDFQRALDADMDPRVEYRTLQSVDKILRANNKTLANYALPPLENYDQDAVYDHHEEDLIDQELNAYPMEQLESTVAGVNNLNEGQRVIFDQVVDAVQNPEVDQKLFIIDRPGGTGKSFLLDQILARVRLDGGVAVAVASSGIAATLLTGGHTAHSTFLIPLKLNDHSTCSISKQSQKAKLIRRANLILWGEPPMMQGACFEAVDRTLRDIMNNEAEPFGGKVMGFSGDYRQILPVLRSATRAEALKVCFKASPLWQ
ncbi:ATP-dependent DNA helicase RRM3 [Phytophthora citrophthora]|uniref:ATP-dependent DNA helicase n=1 Tax=Phytophthora citrophthora TaxID=4793 RepID=A0AAD9G8V4_9STRA|nr:ATP-dependent DNA helicase RRM3 [Phytophthora citrophthora]